MARRVVKFKGYVILDEDDDFGEVVADQWVDVLQDQGLVGEVKEVGSKTLPPDFDDEDTLAAIEEGTL